MNTKPWQALYDPQVPKSIDYPQIGMYQFFERAVEKHPDGVATLFYGAKIRYLELKRLAARFADGLASLGVKKGELAHQLSDSSAETVVILDRLYPKLEQVRSQTPVKRVIVVGIPSKLRDEVVKAFIVLKVGETLSKGEILQFSRDKLAKFKVPKEFEFRESLPKSTVGKVLKRVLRDEELKKKKEN